MAVADGGKTSHIGVLLAAKPLEALDQVQSFCAELHGNLLFGRKLTAGNTKGLPRTLPEMGRAFGKP